MRTDVGTIGVGCAYNPDSTHGHHGTQDFGGAPPPLVGGAHVLVGGAIRFLANVQGTRAPRRVVVVVAGVATPTAPDLGTVLRGTWGAGRVRPLTRHREAHVNRTEDPEIVSQYSREITLGLQGELAEGPIASGKIAATAKHFLADGGTEGGKDQGDARLSEEDLVRIHAAGYKPAIDAGLLTVMMSFSSWHGEKHTGNRSLITDDTAGRLSLVLREVRLSDNEGDAICPAR